MTNVIFPPQFRKTKLRKSKSPDMAAPPGFEDAMTPEDLHTMGLVRDGDFLELLRRAMREVPD